jgi:iron complex transport system substrate-binding protein
MQWMLPLITWCLSLFTWCVVVASIVQAAPPQRIVSLNLCVDQILVDLVPRSRIAAVTHLAADPAVSAAPDKAIGLPVTHGAAEDVLSRHPDLVLAGQYSTPATVDLLRRLGLNVVTIPLPQDYAGVRTVVRQISIAVGEPERGAALIADFDRRLAVAASKAVALNARPTAVVYQVNNYVSRGGSLVDAALVTAGFRNGADTLQTDANGQVALETLLASPPDLLILSAKPDDYQTVVSDNLRHPLLARMTKPGRTAVVPWSQWLCGTPAIADAVETLVKLRLAISATSRPRSPQ